MLSELKEKVKSLLFRRQYAYQQTFKTPIGEEVLKDLARFCRAHETTFHADPRVHATLEGRREVFLRIAQHLELDSTALWKLYGRE